MNRRAARVILFGWTDLEKRSMLESRWWSLEELESTTETIYPEALAELVRVQIKR